MLEPIMAQLQRKLYQSVLGSLQNILTRPQSSNTGNANFKAHPSQFDDLIQQVAEQYRLDPALLKAVAHAESNFSPEATSKAGAKGIMQLTDATAQDLGVQNVFNPAENIAGGASYLRQMLDRYDGNVIMALAAYNAGPGAVDQWDGIPPYTETLAYVPRVLDLHQQYSSTWIA